MRGGGVASWQHDSNLKLAIVPPTVSLCLIDSPHTAFMVSQAEQVSLKSRAGTGSITYYGSSTRLANSSNHLGVSSFTYTRRTLSQWEEHANMETTQQQKE